MIMKKQLFSLITVICFFISSCGCSKLGQQLEHEDIAPLKSDIFAYFDKKQDSLNEAAEDITELDDGFDFIALEKYFPVMDDSISGLYCHRTVDEKDQYSDLDNSNISSLLKSRNIAFIDIIKTADYGKIIEFSCGYTKTNVTTGIYYSPNDVPLYQGEAVEFEKDGTGLKYYEHYTEKITEKWYYYAPIY
jgi:hypothetical protein